MIQLEICVDRIESALAAVAGGADRLEVCGDLGVGGITPGTGLVEQAVALCPIGVMTMIRPHPGSFCYGRHDLDTMLRDIRQAHRLGVQGVVLGALQADGRIDRESTRQLIDAARPLTVTFHRAFDLTPDLREALDDLLDLGVDRLLTSGGAPVALEGTDLIRELVNRAADRLTVMAGAGIRADHVAELVRRTGVREIHASASEEVQPPASRLTGLVQPTRVTSAKLVRGLRDKA